MKELNKSQLHDVDGGIVFLGYFAAAYVSTFVASASFAYGAVNAMNER